MKSTLVNNTAHSDDMLLVLGFLLYFIIKCKYFSIPIAIAKHLEYQWRQSTSGAGRFDQVVVVVQVDCNFERSFSGHQQSTKHGDSGKRRTKRVTSRLRVGLC